MRSKLRGVARARLGHGRGVARARLGHGRGVARARLGHGRGVAGTYPYPAMGDVRGFIAYADLLAGCAAGMAHDALLHPVDTLRARLDVRSGIGGANPLRAMVHEAQQVVAADGFGGLYRGTPRSVAAVTRQSASARIIDMIGTHWRLA